MSRLGRPNAALLLLGVAILWLVVAPAGGLGSLKFHATPTTAAAQGRPVVSAFPHAIPRTILPSHHGALLPIRTVTLSTLLGAAHSGLGPARSSAPGSATPLGAVLAGRPAAVHPTLNQTSVGLQFVTEGINSATAGGGTPPDVQLALGPKQVVEFVNVYGEAFNRTGASLGAAFYLGTFFGTGSDYLSDPKILYDAESGRWFASILHVNSAGTICYNMLAVSTNSSALGTWKIYSLADPSGDLGDQPILGLSSSLIGIAVNQFSSSFVGSEYFVINKTSAMSGGTLQFTTFGPSANDYSIHPVDGVTPNASLFMVETDQSNPNLVNFFTVTGVPPANVSVAEKNLSVTTVTAAPGAPQPGTSDLIDTGDQRVQTSVYESGTIWVAFSDQCLPNGDSTDRACVRLLQFNATTGAVHQDFDLNRSGLYLYYPALALDAGGNLTLVYGGSNSTIYASVYVTGRAAVDPVGFLARPARLIAGNTAQSGCGGSCRFGDYFGASQSALDAHAWVAGEYVGSASGAFWQTALSQVTIAAGPVPLSTSLTTVTPQVDVGQLATVKLTLVNSTCSVSGSDYCSYHLPYTTGSFDGTCLGTFLGGSFALNYSAEGSYPVGSGGYVAVYNESTCNGIPIANLSLTPVTITVWAKPSVSIALVSGGAFGNRIDFGLSFVLRATVTGGLGPFSHSWAGAPAGCVDTPGGVTVRLLNCTPSAIGNVSVAYHLTDADGIHVNTSFSVEVVAAPTLSLNITPGLLVAGVSTRFNASETGGVGEITFVWNHLPSGCFPADVPVIDCTPTTAETDSLSVTVNDSLGVTASASSAVDVHAGLSISLTANVGTHTVGVPLHLDATVGGGVAPYTYSWSGLPPACAAGNVSSLVCSPGTAGTFSLVVNVTDSERGHASAQLTVTVVAAPPGSSPGGSSTVVIEVAAAGVVAVVVVIGLMVALLRRRRK
ncbi:MAG: hypothetical protein L3K09_07460 [Thermoplasmata archaeon]|nr:hypothetical protein [Thermoplasmata archaeon]